MLRKKILAVTASVAGPPFGAVVFQAKVLVRSTGIMARRKDEAAISFAQPDKMRRGRGRKQPALPDNAGRNAIGCCHAQNDLDCCIV